MKIYVGEQGNKVPADIWKNLCRGQWIKVAPSQVAARCQFLVGLLCCHLRGVLSVWRQRGQLNLDGMPAQAEFNLECNRVAS